jgi:hypothetical protein
MHLVGAALGDRSGGPRPAPARRHPARAADSSATRPDRYRGAYRALAVAVPVGRAQPAGPIRSARYRSVPDLVFSLPGVVVSGRPGSAVLRRSSGPVERRHACNLYLPTTEIVASRHRSDRADSSRETSAFPTHGSTKATSRQGPFLTAAGSCRHPAGHRRLARRGIRRACQRRWRSHRVPHARPWDH